jgi:hypothetical protein
MSPKSPRSLRRAYLEWVEEQVEEFKDSIPRTRLLAIADEVVNELRLSRGGQYQLTEILLCDAMNRYLFRLLKLPGYRAWCAQRALDRETPREPRVIPFPVVAQPAVQIQGVAAVARVEDVPVACVG